jgi:SAM-dependent methyltransferase
VTLSGSPFESMRAGYDGVESVFGDRAELDTYREMLLEKSEAQARFIASRAGRGLAVEVACGNGRLLVALMRDGAIEGGLGIDLADSRLQFARSWVCDVGLDNLRFVAGDALEVPLDAAFDLALCITGAFGYFDAYVPQSGAQLLGKLHGALRPGGVLVLELYQPNAGIRLLEAAGGRVRTWIELPSSDPWRFYLSEVWRDGRVIVHEKTFVHRTNGTVDTGRSERMAVYTPEEIEAMLTAAGFADVELFDGWTQAPYAGGDVMVIRAQPKHGV